MTKTNENTSDNRLLDYLHADRIEAECAYRRLRQKLIRYFGWNGCRTPEEQADETIARAVQALARGKTIVRADKPALFVQGIARNVLLEWIRSQKQEPGATNPAEEPRAGSASSPEPSAETECLRLCWRRLRQDRRAALKSGYLDPRPRAAIAHERNVSVNALNQQVWAAARELKACIDRCLEL
jgi:DNA-directed RNA polymerase specialized sigma24 family protein